MAQTTQVVLTGYVGTAPKQWNGEGKTTACSFRVGCSRRYYSVKDGTWKSTETTWINVRAFRALAENVLRSVSVGDPVIVVGNLSVESWEKDGVQHTMPAVEAASIGHDLTYGTDVFAKNEPDRKAEPAAENPPVESSLAQNSQAEPSSAEQSHSAHAHTDTGQERPDEFAMALR